MTTNIQRFPFFQMIDNSMIDLFDVGQKTGCELVDDAHYGVINFWMVTHPNQLKMGVCIPEKCTGADMLRFTNWINPLMQPLCTSVFAGGIVSYKQIQEPVECFFELYSPEERMEIAKEERFTLMASVVTLMLVYTLGLVIVTFMDYFKSILNSKDKEDRVRIKRLLKKSRKQRQKLKTQQRNYQKKKLGVFKAEVFDSTPSPEILETPKRSVKRILTM
mmetsp:Transcript_39609/g.60613  ORF Transcript_39609/g.60613 Transcript_39609/m.60613 type:complete len:219 (+) Transcript_39609:316-972(+)